MTLVVGDFSGVEARALAWCAGDEDELDLIASGADPYKALASVIYSKPVEEVTKVERSAGKAGVLGAGYAGGPAAIERIATAMRIDLAAAGVKPKQVVDAWRSSHEPITKFWKDVQRAFVLASRGQDSSVDVFEFRSSDDGSGDVAVFMPTGRPIVYSDVRVKKEETEWGWRDQITFLGGKSGREYTHGGKLTENVIQALCREILAFSLVQCEREGLNPIMHVHDEIVCDVPPDSAESAEKALTRIMTTLPDWAKATKKKRAFPLGCEVWVGNRYKK